MSFIRILPLLVLLLLSAPGLAAELPLVRLDVVGSPPDEVEVLLDRALQSALEAEAVDREDEERVLRVLRQDSLDVLATEGYFSPQLAFTVDDAARARFLLSVQLGRRAQVTAVEIEFTGAIETRTKRMESLRDDWGLPVGQPFRDADWSGAKTRLLNRVRARDYAAARVADSAAEVNADDASVRLRIQIDSGPAYRVGALSVTGLNRYDEQLVARYNPFEVGDRYDADRLLEFQQRLQRSPYFGSVLVDANPERAVDDVVPIVVEVREAKSKRLSFGLGYSTDVELRAEVAYRQTQLFGYPYTLQSGLGLDKTRQVAYADILLPPKPSGEQDSFGGLIEQTDIEGLATKRWAVGAQRTYTRRSERVTYDTTLALSFQRETKDVEGTPGTNTTNDVVSGTYSWTRRDIDSLTNPTRGTLLTLSGTVGLRRSGLTELLNQTFQRGYGRYVYYWPLSPSDQFILRADAGHVLVDDVNVVPNEFLFRTGGVGTVRGYSYQSLGTKTGSAVTGSKSLLIGSAEYIRWLNGEWGVAAFYDIGNAADDIELADLAPGYGLGVRYRTLAGPIAIDLGYGEKVRKLRLHFSIAIAF